MAAEVLEVDEDVVELRVAIRFNLRKGKQLIIRYELDRLIGVCEGEPGVADDLLLSREPNLFGGLVRQFGSRVAPAQRAGRQRPPVCQRLSLPYLRTRFLSRRYGSESRWQTGGRCLPARWAGATREPNCRTRPPKRFGSRLRRRSSATPGSPSHTPMRRSSSYRMISC